MIDIEVFRLYWPGNGTHLNVAFISLFVKKTKYKTRRICLPYSAVVQKFLETFFLVYNLNTSGSPAVHLGLRFFLHADISKIFPKVNNPDCEYQVERTYIPFPISNTLRPSKARP